MDEKKRRPGSEWFFVNGEKEEWRLKIYSLSVNAEGFSLFSSLSPHNEWVNHF